MKNDDIVLIEQELSIKLPKSYVNVAIEAKLSQTIRPNKLYNDPNKVININKRLRNNGVYGEAWPRNHFVIGYNGDRGEYIFIDINKENGCVYMINRTKAWRYNPDNISNNQVYRTIDEYVNYICFLNDMVKKSESRKPEPIVTKEENQKRIFNFLSSLKKEKSNKE